ncbi:MAG TPA: thiamine phosphate synthase [Thermomicrobiaceae bacterium]|nr:thiamine phosphate synthase [Thermomicrobiaceae bacterium]
MALEAARATLSNALRLYVLTDRQLAGGRSEAEVVRAALAGGATAIQLRWKTGPLREALTVGRELRELCRAAGVLFVVNDRIDLALALEADGVHIGEHDLPLPETRALVGERMLVGYSPPTLVEAIQAARLGADYLGIGPVFSTRTKVDAGEPVGLKRIREVAETVTLPLVGIGGIDAENAASVIEAGADGVAVISAVVAAPDIAAAAGHLRRVVDSALDLRP